MNEAEVIGRILKGEAELFRELVHRYQPRIYRVILRMVRNTADSEDLMQMTFVAAYEKLKQYRGESAFATWLTAIALNIVRVHFRRQSVERWLSLEAVLVATGEEPAVADEGAGIIDRLWLRGALDRLPFPARTVIILHELEGYSHEEIAAIMHCPVGTVWSHLSRAKQALRRLLGDDRHD